MEKKDKAEFAMEIFFSQQDKAEHVLLSFEETLSGQPHNTGFVGDCDIILGVFRLH
jgi:hypothetical protein